MNDLLERIDKLELEVVNLEKENVRLRNKLENHETVWDRIDRDVQLFGNKTIAMNLKVDMLSRVTMKNGVVIPNVMSQEEADEFYNKMMGNEDE